MLSVQSRLKDGGQHVRDLSCASSSLSSVHVLTFLQYCLWIS